MNPRVFWKKFRLRPRISIYIIPTWFCLLFSTCLIAYASYGVGTRNAIPIAGGIFLFLIELLAMVETNMNVRDMSILSVRCPPVAEDQEGIAHAEVTASAKVWAIGLSAKIKKSVLREVNMASLDPQITKNSLIAIPLPPRSRGIYEVPPIRASSRFPLGMFHAWRNFEASSKQVVYPRPFGEPLSTIMQEGMSENLNGSALAHPLDQEYKQHREFSQGDSVRRIDWRASSRRGTYITKEYEGSPESQSLVLRWNDTSQIHPEDKLRQLSLWIQEAKAKNLRYGLETPLLKIHIGTGEDHWRQCVTHLAGFGVTRESLGNTA